MYIRIAADGSPKELAKLFRSIAESFEEINDGNDGEDKGNSDKSE